MEAGVADTQDRDTLQVNNPVCPVCVHPMSTLRIEPGEPDHQMRTYKCLDCRIVEVKMVKRR
jgi:hypothetical protein